MSRLKHKNGILTLNNFKEYKLNFDWKDIFIQANDKGLVIGKEPYTTAFFESFPLKTFIRGEGKTIEEAEENAWNTYQQYLKCPKHEYKQIKESHHRGQCIHCGIEHSYIYKLKTQCKECKKTDAIFYFSDYILNKDIDFLFKDFLDNKNKLIPSEQKPEPYCYEHYLDKINAIDIEKYNNFLNLFNQHHNEEFEVSVFVHEVINKIKYELYFKYFSNEKEYSTNALFLKHIEDLFFDHHRFLKNNFIVVADKLNDTLNFGELIELMEIKFLDYDNLYQSFDNYIQFKMNNSKEEKDFYIDNDYIRKLIKDVKN